MLFEFFLLIHTLALGLIAWDEPLLLTSLLMHKHLKHKSTLNNNHGCSIINSLINKRP